MKKQNKGEFTYELLEKIKIQAKKDIKKIVLPETEDMRTIAAADMILADGMAEIVLVGNKEEILSKAEGYDLSKAEFIDPANFEKMGEFIDAFVEMRKKKGMTPEKAKEVLANPLYFGCMLVKLGHADGMVGGAVNATADVMRAALQVIKTAPGTKLVSAAFLMEVPNCEFGSDGIFIFADTALNPNPDSEQLANIAISSAATFEALTGVEPVVSMLSFSTKGSANHPDVDKVIEGGRLAKEMAPDLKLDCELQFDASIVPAIGKKKAPDSDVAGKANVIIFPDLDAGNIGYKLVQRLAKANAYGPVTQGLAMPVNDLSRGCSAEDIVGTVALTVLQAQMMK